MYRWCILYNVRINFKQLLDEVFVISRIIKVSVRVISWSRSFMKHWMKQKKSCFASSLTASKTQRGNLTWLLLEIMHRGHTWHNYPWPWVPLTWLLYNQLWHHRRWFWKFTVRFWLIRKEIVSSMYDKLSYYAGNSFLTFSVGRQLVFTGGQNYLNWTSNVKKTFFYMFKPGWQNHSHNHFAQTFIKPLLLHYQAYANSLLMQTLNLVDGQFYKTLAFFSGLE